MKRTVSFMIAFCLLLGLTSTISFAALPAFAGESANYVFECKGTWSNPTSSTSTDAVGITYDYTVGGNWEWYGASEGVVSNGGKTKMYSTQFQINGMVVGQWTALTLNVPKAGRYYVSYQHRVTNSTALGKYDIYIIPKNTVDIDAALNSSSYVTTADDHDPAATANVWTYENTDDEVVSFDAAGEYLLVLKMARAGNIRAKSLTLNGVEKDITIGSLNCEDISIFENATKQVSFSATDSNGDALKLADLHSISFESQNTDIATVSEDGIVTGISTGETVVRVTANTLNGSKTQNIAVTVLGAPSGVKVKYDFSPSLFTFPSGSQIDVTDYEYSDTANFWRFSYNFERVGCGINKYSYLKFDKSTNQFVSGIDIYVPKAGVYDVTLNYLQRDYGAKGRMYIFPGDAPNIEEQLGSATPLCAFDCGGSTSTAVLQNTSAGMYLFPEAGTYTVAFEKYENNSYNGNAAYQLYVTSIELDGGTGIVPMMADPGSYSTTVGDTETITASATKMSDGTAATVMSYSYESLTPEIATVNAETGVVSAVRSGVAKIKVTGTAAPACL